MKRISIPTKRPIQMEWLDIKVDRGSETGGYLSFKKTFHNNIGSSKQKISKLFIERISFLKRNVHNDNSTRMELKATKLSEHPRTLNIDLSSFSVRVSCLLSLSSEV